MNFSKFDKMINKEQLAKDIEEAVKNGGSGDFPEIPDGRYIVRIETMELGETKDERPMFKATFRIIEAVEGGDFDFDNEKAVKFIDNWQGKKKPCLFMNRVVYGTKNDGNMIASVIGFLSKLESEITPIVFETYSQFKELILDVMEDVDNVLEYEIEYKKDSFNSISIKDVFEI